MERKCRLYLRKKKFEKDLKKMLNEKANSHSPVAVNEGIKQIADGDGHQGEHKHPRPCRRAHCGCVDL